MPSIPVQCMVCNKSVKDSMFPQHMQSVHGGMTQAEAIAAENNIPLQPQTPIILDKESPPSKEFMEVAEMLDKPKLPPVVNSKTEDQSVRAAQQLQREEIKPIKLEYKYSGQCKDCLITVDTLVVKVKGQTVAVAFCSNHGQLAEREVADLEEKEEMKISNIPTILVEKKTNKILADPNKVFIKKGGKRVKQRPKSFIQHPSTL
jgi:hypothetical protein